MDNNPDSSAPAPEPKTDDTKAPDVSMSLNDAPTTSSTTTTTTTTVATGANPGHGLGIASLITSILGLGIIGIVLGIIGTIKSKKVGQKNGLALAGIIVGVLSTILLTIIIIVASMGAATLLNKCAELGSGVHVDSGVTYTCNV